MTGLERLGPLAVEANSPEARVLMRSILGTTDGTRIFRQIRGFCAAGGLPAPDRVFLFEISVGAAFGLLLEDGSSVMLKAHPAERDTAFLEAACRVQRHLYRKGFPCPRPILGPAPLDKGYAVAEEFVDRGERADAHKPGVRRAMARALARVIREASEIPGVDGLNRDWQWPQDRLWPTPHNALFDFEGTAAGAGWIDDLAAAAKRVVDTSASPVVVGHGDWSVKHLRFEDGEISVVYDWDSLRLTKEAIIVGTAAATFPATWYVPVASLTPSPEEMRLFLGEYEASRGRPFSSEERRAAVAGAVYWLTYGARCEHGLHPGRDDVPGGFREALRGREDEYLSLATGEGWPVT